MSAISYQIINGQVLEQVTTGANAPAGGNGAVEVRMDTTANAITDGSVAGGLRAMKKGEIVANLIILLQYLIRDTNITE